MVYLTGKCKRVDVTSSNYINGATKFTVLIVKSLINCKQLPVVDFGAIECILVVINKCKQSSRTDQLYLLKICQAIHSGSCDVNSQKKP